MYQSAAIYKMERILIQDLKETCLVFFNYQRDMPLFECNADRREVYCKTFEYLNLQSRTFKVPLNYALNGIAEIEEFR